MADFTQLYQWIDAGENDVLDFKKSITSLHKFARTVCAFANHKGGKLVVGIDDFGEITGIDIDEEKFMLNDIAHSYVDPIIDLSFTVFQEEDLFVLVAQIPEAKMKPVKALKKNGEWQAYVRIGDKSMIASEMVIKSMQYEQREDEFKDLDEENVFTSKEQGLIEFLKKRERATIQDYMQLMNISYRRARRSMTNLVLMGVVRKVDQGSDDYYMLA